MQFIHSIPELSQEFDNSDKKIQQMNFQISDEFHSKFNYFETEKKLFINNIKSQKKILLQEKKQKMDEELLESMKKSLKIDVEETFFKEKYANTIPSYNKDQLKKCAQLDDLFLNLSKKSQNHPELITILEQYKLQSEELINELSTIYTTLEQINNNI
jgi:hypothetical protein